MAHYGKYGSVALWEYNPQTIGNSPRSIYSHHHLPESLILIEKSHRTGYKYAQYIPKFPIRYNLKRF
jgi:hypothetical protein